MCVHYVCTTNERDCPVDTPGWLHALLRTFVDNILLREYFCVNNSTCIMQLSVHIERVCC
jgi:hypothetical protein